MKDIIIVHERGFTYIGEGELAPDVVGDGENDHLAMLLLLYSSILRFHTYIDREL